MADLFKIGANPSLNPNIRIGENPFGSGYTAGGSTGTSGEQGAGQGVGFETNYKTGVVNPGSVVHRIAEGDSFHTNGGGGGIYTMWYSA